MMAAALSEKAPYLGRAAIYDVNYSICQTNPFE